MDINHIDLPAIVVADLYPHTLIQTGEITSANKPTPAKNSTAETTKTWKWLGDNKKNILVIVRYEDAVHLPDEELQFLTNMLTACQLSLADVAIINLENQPHQTYKDIIKQFQGKVALLFDIDPLTLGLPISFPFFQIQPFAGCSFLYAPALKELNSDKMQKSKLWIALRRLFNI